MQLACQRSEVYIHNVRCHKSKEDPRTRKLRVRSTCETCELDWQPKAIKPTIQKKNPNRFTSTIYWHIHSVYYTYTHNCIVSDDWNESKINCERIQATESDINRCIPNSDRLSLRNDFINAKNVATFMLYEFDRLQNWS